MNLLFLGDIVGKLGLEAVEKYLEINKGRYDFVVANGENISGGKGLSRTDAEIVQNLPINALTMGNHTWDKKDFELMAQESPFIRPINYPPGTPGKGIRQFSVNKQKIWVINLLGTVFMENLFPPFQTIEKAIAERDKDTIIIVDFHAEATSEKKALGHFLAGKVTALLGTHTHVQTADEEILPGGTAYITDTGMCGPRDSVLGVKKEIAINRFITKMPVRFELSDRTPMVNGVEIEIAPDGKASKITRINEDIIL